MHVDSIIIQLPGRSPTSATLWRGLGVLFCYKEKKKKKKEKQEGDHEDVCLIRAHIYVCDQRSRQRGVSSIGDALLHRVSFVQLDWRRSLRYIPQTSFSPSSGHQGVFWSVSKPQALVICSIAYGEVRLRRFVTPHRRRSSSRTIFSTPWNLQFKSATQAAGTLWIKSSLSTCLPLGEPLSMVCPCCHQEVETLC